MNHPSSLHGTGSGSPDVVVVGFIVVDVEDVTVVDEDVAVVEVLEVDPVVDVEIVELDLVVVDDGV